MSDKAQRIDNLKERLAYYTDVTNDWYMQEKVKAWIAEIEAEDDAPMIADLSKVSTKELWEAVTGEPY